MFYISSRGSSATVWVAKILNSFSNIVCFNASRSFPPLSPGNTFPIHPWVHEISPKRYIESLVIAESSCNNEINFGSIHGYHGTSAKIDCEKNGGKFFFITREPLERIHSVFILNLSKQFYNGVLVNKKIFDHIISLFNNYDLPENYINKKSKNFFKNSSLFKFAYKKIILNSNFLYEKLKNQQVKNRIFKTNNSYKKIKTIKDEKKYIINMFANLCDDFFSKEKQLVSECGPKNGLKMEELVKSKLYFSNYLLKKIDSRNFERNNSVLKKVSFSNRINTHRDNPLKSKEIWEKLPKIFKLIYLQKFKKYNLQKVCKQFDYDYSYLD